MTRRSSFAGRKAVRSPKDARSRAARVCAPLILVAVCSAYAPAAQPRSLAVADASGDFRATVSTFAGSGKLGTADGPAATATFMYPMGVAIGPGGAVYVADTGAQRIRMIRDGRVTTVAGSNSSYARGGLWILGGFRDGPVAQAEFSDPKGIAVDAAGRIYVADTDNHCVRLIERGVVSTFAGDPTILGPNDGQGSKAFFDRPVSIALDPHGGLYVADYGNGIRHVDAARNVTTVLKDATATGVSVSSGPKHTVFVADRDSLRLLEAGGQIEISTAGRRDNESPALAMDANLGHPFFVSAIDDERTFYTDEQTGAVRYADTYNGTLRVVVGPRYEDSSNDGAAFRDGEAAQAAVFDAAAIAYDGRARTLVADAGNRRVRSIDGLDLRTAILPGVELIPAETASRGRFRVDVIGSSIVWTNTVWDTSIEGALERGLNRGRSAVRVRAVRMQAVRLRDALTYLDDVVAPTRAADLAVLVINDGMLDVEGVDWEPVLTTQLGATRARLEAAGIRLVVVYHPMASDYRGPDFFRLDTSARGGEAVQGLGLSHERVARDVERAGVPLIDVWADFEAWQKSANRPPLFGTDDKHLTVAGRQFMGDLLAKDLAPYMK